MRAGRNEADEQFAAFVTSWQRRLERTAYLLCGDRHRAQDVVQTVLVRMYLRWPRVADCAVAYARRSIANAVVDERRRPWRREVPVDAMPESFAPQTAPVGIEDAALLAALGARQRAVVVLRYVEDLDVEATAAALGISTGTVKSQAARALAALRERPTANSGVQEELR